MSAIWSWRGPTGPGTREFTGCQTTCCSARTPRNLSPAVPPRGHRRLRLSARHRFDSGIICNRWRLTISVGSRPRLMAGRLGLAVQAVFPPPDARLAEHPKGVWLHRIANSPLVAFRHGEGQGGSFPLPLRSPSTRVARREPSWVVGQGPGLRMAIACPADHRSGVRRCPRLVWPLRGLPIGEVFPSGPGGTSGP